MFNCSNSLRRFSATSTVAATVVALILLFAMLTSLASCASGDRYEVYGDAADTAATPTETVEVTNLVLASTTSTQDSGLFEALIPAFEDTHPEVHVQVIAVGSGEAMEMGRRGDADLLLVHSPAAEIAFMDKGYGKTRKPVMYNDFVVVGPEDDPAHIAGTDTAAEAFESVADMQARFVSRGDDSGTHAREMSIWAEANIDPEGNWYEESGQGMGATLLIAEEFQAYTLSDRATFLTQTNEGAITMSILSEGSTELLNFYHIITLIDAREQVAAQIFADWIVSPLGQEVIAGFGIEEFGAPLFTPNADN